MKVWASVSVLLVVLLFADKGAARPSDGDDEDGFQDDEAVDNPAEPSLPAAITSPPLRLTPRPGHTIYLPCDTKNVPDNANVVWMNKTSTIFLGQRPLGVGAQNRIVLHPNRTLQISDVNSADTGSFTCRYQTGIEVVHNVDVYEMGSNAATVDSRICFSLLLGSLFALLARS